MECAINNLKKANSTLFIKSNEDFQREIALGWLGSLIYEKQHELSQYINAYDELDDKDSFKAEYIESIIYLLNLEIKDLKKCY